MNEVGVAQAGKLDSILAQISSHSTSTVTRLERLRDEAAQASQTQRNELDAKFEAFDAASAKWMNHVAQTHAAIGKRRGITANTIGSALERLFKKGMVRRDKVSHAYRYYPVLDRHEFRARRVLEAAGGKKALSAAGLLSAFVDLVADTDDAALDRLEALIAKKRELRGGK